MSHYQRHHGIGLLSENDCPQVLDWGPWYLNSNPTDPFLWETASGIGGTVVLKQCGSSNDILAWIVHLRNYTTDPEFVSGFGPCPLGCPQPERFRDGAIRDGATGSGATSPGHRGD